MFDTSKVAKFYCIVEYQKNEFATHATSLSDSTHNHTNMPYFVCPIWNHEATFDDSRKDGRLVISVWDRNGDENGEVFYGQVCIECPKSMTQAVDSWYPLLPRQDGERTTGEIHVGYFRQDLQGKPLSSTDFEMLKVLGQGNFGKVLQVRKKDTGRIYAMKVLSKKNIIASQVVSHTLSERNILIQMRSPFLVALKFSFQTPTKLYLILDYLNGGELFYHLTKEEAFSESRAKFYIAEIILALECLHSHGIMYRDLKPENVLLDSNGHIALTDFGLSKENLYNATTNTFCGTAEYLAPEILLGQGYGLSVDWWSVGIIFYEMVTGLPPFYSENTNVMYSKILHEAIPSVENMSPMAMDLVRNLLHRDPKRRLGSNGTDEIKRHPYFADVHWDQLAHKQVIPPFKPRIASETDTSYFDTSFTSITPQESLCSGSAPLSETYQNHFKGFTYNEETATPLSMALTR